MTDKAGAKRVSIRTRAFPEEWTARENIPLIPLRLFSESGFHQLIRRPLFPFTVNGETEMLTFADYQKCIGKEVSVSASHVAAPLIGVDMFSTPCSC